MNPLFLWFGLSLLGLFVYMFFRARWWLYISLIGLDMLFMAALGLDKISQLIAGGLLLLGFLLLDLLFLRRKISGDSPDSPK